MAYIPTLKTKYAEEILPALMKEYGYKTVMQAPRLKKITLNQGLGKAAIADKKVIDKGIEEMTLIAGQRAVATKVRTSSTNWRRELSRLSRTIRRLLSRHGAVLL